MSTTLNKKKEIDLLKEQIRNNYLKKFEIISNDKLLSTLYITEQNDSYFNLYCIFEPKSTEYSGSNGIVSMLKYDLRNKEYELTRDNKEVQFSSRNLNSIFSLSNNKEEILLWLGYGENKEMFLELYECVSRLEIGRLGMSLPRYFESLMNKYNKLEILYKADIIKGITKGEELINIFSVVTKPDRYVVHNKIRLFGDYKFTGYYTNTGYMKFNNCIDLTKNRPHEILNIRKKDLKMIKNLSNIGVLRNIVKSHINDSFINFTNQINRLKDKEDFVQELNQYLLKSEPLGYIYDKVSQYYIDLNKKYSLYNRPIGEILFIKEFSYIIHRIQELIRNYGGEFKRYFEYLIFQTNVEQGIVEPRDAANLLIDYLKMSKDMKVRNIERYPKSLKLSHDIITKNYKLNLNEIQNEQWNEKYLENISLEFSDNEYSIIYPKEPNDLVLEGNSLRHCVASYVSKVLNSKESFILFLRKNKDIDKSYFTIELREGKIVQIRGNMNEPIRNQKDKDFIKKYEKYLKKVF